KGNHSGRKRTQRRMQNKSEWKRRPLPICHSCNHLPLHKLLECLDNLRWTLTPALHTREIGSGCFAALEVGRQNISGGNCVLDRVINARAANGSHHMGGVTDQQQSRTVPAFESARFYREDGNLFPLGDCL